MSFATINELKTKLNKGSRANLFEVSLAFPSQVLTTVGANTTDASVQWGLLCKSAAIPGMTIGTIEVPFRAGRKIKVPGDRTFADWSVTIINDENHKLRRLFTEWINFISTGDYESATKSTNTDYYQDILVTHLKADGTASRFYELNGAYPTDIGALDLSYDSTDTLSEFTVNFQYHYLKAGATNNFATLAADMTT
jgi:hypothetical protein